MPESAANNADLKTCDLEELSIVRKISIVTVKDREQHPAVRRLIQHVLVAYQ
jgi:DNA-binding transcriptional LysR family regulator